MSSGAYTEDSLFRQTTAEYLEQELGWDSVYAYNNEGFGPESLLGRGSDREVVLTRVLRGKLVELNPGLPETAYEDAVREIVAEYNQEKDRVTIEKAFEALLRFVDALDEEEGRAMREGLDEESLAVFDLLVKQDLNPSDIKRIKTVAVELLKRLKAEKLRVDHWREKESTRDAVRITIRDFLWSDETGLPVDAYDEAEVNVRAEEVFVHVFRAYSTVPSPYCTAAAS